MTKKEALENYQWYQKYHNELFEMYPNKWLAIADCEVKCWDTNEDRLRKTASEKYGYGNFLIYHCTQDLNHIIRINLPLNLSEQCTTN